MKGRQDDDLKQIMGDVGPMPMVAHYNIEMDKRAEHRRQMSTTTYTTIPMTTDLASISICDCFITSRLNESITQAFTTSPLRTYVSEKTWWTRNMFNAVDWESLGAYMKGMLVAK